MVLALYYPVAVKRLFNLHVHFQASFTACYCLSATDSSSRRPVFYIYIMLCDNVRCQNPTKNFRVICQDLKLPICTCLLFGGDMGNVRYSVFAGCEVFECAYYLCTCHSVLKIFTCVCTCALWACWYWKGIVLRWVLNGKRCHFITSVTTRLAVMFYCMSLMENECLLQLSLVCQME